MVVWPTSSTEGVWSFVCIEYDTELLHIVHSFDVSSKAVNTLSRSRL